MFEQLRARFPASQGNLTVGDVVPVAIVLAAIMGLTIPAATMLLISLRDTALVMGTWAALGALIGWSRTSVPLVPRLCATVVAAVAVSAVFVIVALNYTRDWFHVSDADRFLHVLGLIALAIAGVFTGLMIGFGLRWRIVRPAIAIVRPAVRPAIAVLSISALAPALWLLVTTAFASSWDGGAFGHGRFYDYQVEPAVKFWLGSLPAAFGMWLLRRRSGSGAIPAFALWSLPSLAGVFSMALFSSSIRDSCDWFCMSWGSLSDGSSGLAKLMVGLAGLIWIHLGIVGLIDLRRQFQSEDKAE